MSLTDAPPPSQKRRAYIMQALARYWPKGKKYIEDLPIPEVVVSHEERLPPKLSDVELPYASASVGINGSILIPTQFIAPGDGPEWSRTDWLSAAYWYINGLSERAYERRFGPIHSNSSRLQHWDSRLWERAWVNRIALFLRRWAAEKQHSSEEDLFGPLPEPEIFITHDVDAITKTKAIRFRQTFVRLQSALLCALRGQFRAAVGFLAGSLRFLFSHNNYWCFYEIVSLEQQYDVTSYFFFYGGPSGSKRGTKEQFYDPAYDVTSPELQEQIQLLHSGGWKVGVHQSYNAWRSSGKMTAQRERIEKGLRFPIVACRQHRLRFSWRDTWLAQQEAGLTLDMTLGFRDRPGFRAGAALSYHPWDSVIKAPMSLKVVPTVLIDSHLYDYVAFDEEARERSMAHWLGEVKAVHGTASVVWHQEVMRDDYGRADGFETLLRLINEKKK